MQGLPGELHVKPKTLSFDYTDGGEHSITVQNKSKKRMAIKLKVTGDHDFYAALPVFDFVEVGGSCVVKIMRLKASEGAGTDPQMLIVLEATVDSAAADPKDAFNQGSVYPFNAVHLKIIQRAEGSASQFGKGATVAPAGSEGSSRSDWFNKDPKTGLAPAGTGSTSGYGQGSTVAPASGETSSYGKGGKQAPRGKPSAGGTSGYGQGSTFVPQGSAYGKGSTAPGTTASTSAYGNQKTSAYGKGPTASPSGTSAYGQGPTAPQKSTYGRGSTFAAAPGPARSGSTSLYGRAGSGSAPIRPSVYAVGGNFNAPPAPGQQPQRPPAPSGSTSLYGKGRSATPVQKKLPALAPKAPTQAPAPKAPAPAPAPKAPAPAPAPKA